VRGARVSFDHLCTDASGMDNSVQKGEGEGEWGRSELHVVGVVPRGCFLLFQTDRLYPVQF